VPRQSVLDDGEPQTRAARLARNEYLQFYRLGIDGLFSDFADTAVAARILFELENNPDGGRCLTGDRDGPKRHQPECPDQGD